MFGLHNHRGSCWVNAALQAIFRIPDVQTRYNQKTIDKASILDQCMSTIWSTRGEHGLRDFFEAVRTDTMPAGMDVGDSHELIQYLCDKLPFLDETCRFKVAYCIECKSCKKKSITYDSVIEFTLDSVNGTHVPLSSCIKQTTDPYSVNEWECESCHGKGGMRQQLIGTFPRCMVFHAPIANTTIDYSSIVVLNKQTYALASIVCYDGGHWWTYGRNMPPGSAWYTLNDTHVTEHGPKQFPVSPHMRMLFYYRLDE